MVPVLGVHWASHAKGAQVDWWWYWNFMLSRGVKVLLSSAAWELSVGFFGRLMGGEAWGKEARKTQAGEEGVFGRSAI